MLPLDNQVVALLVRGFNFPTSSGYGHPSNTPMSGSMLHSSLHGILPRVGWSGCSHDSRVASLSNVVVGLASIDFSMHNFLWPGGATLVFSSRISLSSVILFFLSRSHSSSSSRSLMIPLRRSSCHCLIP